MILSPKNIPFYLRETQKRLDIPIIYFDGGINKTEKKRMRDKMHCKGGMNIINPSIKSSEEYIQKLDSYY